MENTLEYKLRSDKVQELAETFLKMVDLVDRIRQAHVEMSALLRGLEGGYVEPGPSGSLTRGKFEILPTGRNFYAVDPRCLPTPAAWEVGVKCAVKLLEEYRARHGTYPESVGVVLWSIDAYKADGEQLAMILYLIGVRPVWGPDGSVVDIEVIPLRELGRPRIDVVVRISGIVRDTLPNYVYLIDKAVCKVASLDEPLEMNYVRKHYLENLKSLLELGRSIDEAEELAKCRVFAEPPGTYGAGVNYAVEASAWRTIEDLGKVWLSWSSYAYTSKTFGRSAPDALVLSLRYVQVVTRNHPSDEHDILNCCCYFAYHGGFHAAVRAVTGRDVDIVQIDTTDISRVEVRDIRLEIERIVRAKLLNKRWIEEMRKHGYSGASEIFRKILHLYGWVSTTGKVPDWVFTEIARTYVLDEDMRRWFMQENKYALEEIARRLLEAARRGVWRAPPDVLEKLEETYAEIEASLEDEVTSEVQGGNIIVYTAENCEEYARLVRDVELVLDKVKNRC